MAKHVLEIQVKNRVVHVEMIQEYESPTDIFNEHLKQSIPGETFFLYDETNGEENRVLVRTEESPYNN